MSEAHQVDTFGNEDAQYDSDPNFVDSFCSTSSTRLYLEGSTPTIVGAKGMGKSACLIMKLIRQRKDPSTLTIPDSGKPDALGYEASGAGVLQAPGTPYLQLSSATWKLAFMHSIAVKLADQVEMDPSSRLRRYVELRRLSLNQPSHCYSNILGQLSSRRAKDRYGFLLREREELRPLLLDSLKLAATLYVFIDNNDASYEENPAQWTQAVYAQFLAAREIEREFHGRVHVHSTMREEIAARTIDKSEQSLNFAQAILRLRWLDSDLRHVFEARVRRLRIRYLRNPELQASDPISAFLGSGRIANLQTGKEEDRFDYVLRHTLRRPRDLIVIGNRIIEAIKGKGTAIDDASLRAAINSGAKAIADQYLLEVRPVLQSAGILDQDGFFKLLPRAILSLKEAERIRDKAHADYVQRPQTEGEGSNVPGDVNKFHPFCALARVGLVGWVEEGAHEGRAMQRFRSPSEGIPLGDRPDLDDVSTRVFLVHPILFDKYSNLVLASQGQRKLGPLGPNLPFAENWTIPAKK